MQNMGKPKQNNTLHQPIKTEPFLVAGKEL